MRAVLVALLGSIVLAGCEKTGDDGGAVVSPLQEPAHSPAAAPTAPTAPALPAAPAAPEAAPAAPMPPAQPTTATAKTALGSRKKQEEAGLQEELTQLSGGDGPTSDNWVFGGRLDPPEGFITVPLPKSEPGSGSGTGWGSPGPRPRSAPRPEATVSTPRILSGKRDANFTRRYILRQLASIKHCYEKQWLEKPSLKGSLTVDFSVDATGAVLAAKARGMTTEVARCVEGVFREIRFRAEEGGESPVRATVKFTFKASK